MLVQSMTEEEIYGIGHSFGYYDYGQETGMSAAFSGKDATANYICAYVRGVLRSGFLHTTSDRLGVPVILETDAKSKCDKYVHLDMELAETHDLGAFGKLYDLTPALCHLDYTMSEAGGVTNFVRQYTLASGGPYCDCGYKKKKNK